MTLLAPLGLLGLLSIAVLILIYILKPNYQQKLVSSTFVWKLSLKYKKKKIPISKLRNILLVICQVLILTACAFVLTDPAKRLQAQVDGREVIAIIDASASMRATDEEGVSRFERAVTGARELSEDVLKSNGYVSLILAKDKPEMQISRGTKEREVEFSELFEDLIGDDANAMMCSYGMADLDEALSSCEEILLDNPSAQIYLYTDMKYAYIPPEINVVDVSDEEEWNAGILNAYAEMEDNYYSVTVNLGCYGKPAAVIDISVSIEGANATDEGDSGLTVPYSASVRFQGDGEKTVVFKPVATESDLPVVPDDEMDVIYVPITSELDKVFSYQSIHVALELRDGTDSFIEDDNFRIYGGQKEIIKVLYASTMPNPFFNNVLEVLRNRYSNQWELWITEIDLQKTQGECPTIGYDFYLFEHLMPKVMPKDGIVMLADPDRAPQGSGITLGNTYEFSRSDGSTGYQTFSATESAAQHPLLNRIVPEEIEVSRIVRINNYDADFEEVMTCGTFTSLLVKKKGDEQVIVMPFSLHHSNIVLQKEFPLLMDNIFTYFLPSTVNRNAFEVNEKVSLNARGEYVTISGFNYEEKVSEFPSEVLLTEPGTYQISQMTYFGKSVDENIYVKVPSAESNIRAVGVTLTNPYTVKDDRNFYEDLAVFVAAALVALLFLEWWLQSRDNG